MTNKTIFGDLLALNTLNAAGWALGGYKVINAIKLRFVVYW
jgi:hypothetical protein